jgi:hypothetical protein
MASTDDSETSELGSAAEICSLVIGRICCRGTMRVQKGGQTLVAGVTDCRTKTNLQRME